MLSAAILYIIAAYPVEERYCVNDKCHALVLCSEHEKDLKAPEGYELVFEACEYIKNPYIDGKGKEL